MFVSLCRSLLEGSVGTVAGRIAEPQAPHRDIVLLRVGDVT
jgi:hypothetical protein